MEHLRYLTDHYDEKIQKILDIDAPLNFIFITDQHNRMNQYAYENKYLEIDGYELGVNAVDSMQYILDRCPNIACVISGGDIGNDYHRDADEVRKSHQEIMDAMYRLSVPLHCVVGNHDDALGHACALNFDTRKYGILPEEMHELCMKNNPTSENYYYIDFEEQGYRFIFLNTSDKPYLTDENGQYPTCLGWRLEVSAKQALWLEKEALNTSKKIIVFSHSPIHNAGIIGSEGEPELIKPYDDLLGGPRVYHAIKQCPNVVAMIAGHVHFDNLLYDDGIVSVTSLSSLAQEWSPLCPKREFGTITETAFDVFSFKDNHIYITRFGAGEDRMATMLRY
jgi:hypothetical protein